MRYETLEIAKRTKKQRKRLEMELEHHGMKVSIADDLIAELRSKYNEDATAIVKRVLDEEYDKEFTKNFGIKTEEENK